MTRSAVVGGRGWGGLAMIATSVAPSSAVVVIAAGVRSAIALVAAPLATTPSASGRS